MLDNSNHIKLVFFDIDDTLYSKEQNYLPKSIPLVISQLKQQGIIPAIATGRARCAFPQEVDRLIEQQNIDVLVTINGQFNSYKNKVVKKFPMDKNEIQKVIDFCNQWQIDYGFVTHDYMLVSNVSPSLKAALDPITTNYSVDKNYHLTHDIFQMLLFYDGTRDALIEQSNILGNNLKVVRWHDFSVDLLDKSGSKARGIEAVIKKMQLSPNNVLAFGDGLNDIDMMRYVGVSVAMGNARPELKKVTKYTTKSIHEDGIAYFLNQFGLIK